ncbi:hypothetical protein FQN60_002191 [Etheostoma spectabile]|uniref:Uncharacterized protein n=1 Tax=Etheostoma spectabile TaxID=54343 RepID=A0A5J5D963_9PERO|nr:hypothetical protein FQN60_002191 [Etheostoma spectabile]
MAVGGKKEKRMKIEEWTVSVFSLALALLISGFTGGEVSPPKRSLHPKGNASARCSLSGSSIHLNIPQLS